VEYNILIKRVIVYIS